MDLDPMSNTSQDENSYSDYDNRPIRPMDQEALTEALARLPILVDEEESVGPSESNSSIKARRQPILAYSTRRKDFTGVNINQSVLNMTGTPMNNKRKLAGSTPTNKYVKQLDTRPDLIQLKEENRLLEEAKANLQLECGLLKKSHENELELLNHEHRQAVEALVQENQLRRELFIASLTEKEQLLAQATLALDTLRNDHTMLLLEKDTLDKIVAEHELVKREMDHKLTEKEATLKNLRGEVEKLSKMPPQARSVPKETSTERPRIGRSEATRSKPAGRGLIVSLSNATSNLNKPATTKPSLSKASVTLDDKKKSAKQLNPSSARPKPKLPPMIK